MGANRQYNANRKVRTFYRKEDNHNLRHAEAYNALCLCIFQVLMVIFYYISVSSFYDCV